MPLYFFKLEIVNLNNVSRIFGNESAYNLPSLINVY